MSFTLGLMSGTSMDGIDVALIDPKTQDLQYGLTMPYPKEVQTALYDALQTKHLTFAQMAILNTLIGRAFAMSANTLLKKAGVLPHQVLAIGSHGQTVCHDATAPIPYTMQLGCAHTIAEHTKIPVVADFRTRDVVLGGQGAPFAPLYHQHLWHNLNECVAVVNIGGIANVSFVHGEKPILGFDCGPGNVLMDAWVHHHRGLNYDEGGQWAALGQVIPSLLDALLGDPFFATPAPKSIGKEYFSQAWLKSHLQENFEACDVQATLLMLSVCGIAKVIHAYVQKVQRLIVCGGGAHNKTLLQKLQEILPNVRVDVSDALGVSADYMEAMMFGWFAYQTMNKIPLDLTSITGAQKASVMGVVYWP